MLKLNNVSKIFIHSPRASSVEIIEVNRNISFLVKEGEFVAFVGPSGGGKTTLLKIIAGLTEPTSGEAVLNGKKILCPGKDRGMVSQSFTLFPWLTVRGNIAFGPNLHKLGLAKKEKVVDHYLRITGLADFADFYPKNLSSGMQQRVAIARMLANDPKVLLMDEPFGALDAQTRSKMQEFLANLWEKEHKTVLFVTHDIEEAIFLADRVIVLSPRPAKIKKEFIIHFDRPRIHDLKFSNEFFALKKEIAKLL